MKKPLLLALIILACQSLKLMAQGGMQFNSAIPNYVEMGNSINQELRTTNTITVEAWCYLNAYTFLPTLVGNYGNSTMQFLLRIDNSRPAFWVEGGSGFRVVNGTTVVPLNTWTHLAGVWDGTALRVYINGVLNGTTTSVTGQFNNTTHPVRVGASLTSEAFTGRIDEVRIWSTARSQTEIQTYMNNCLQSNWAGLIAAYSFEEGSGLSVADRTGNGHDGTLVSSPSWTTGIGCTTLPVNFVSVGAKADGTAVAIQWKVAAEQDLLRYEVERSVDGSRYESIGTVAARGATEYQWQDASPLSTTAYYRIKAVEAAGGYKYSSIVRQSINLLATGLDIAPNPARGKEVNLKLTQQPAGRYEAQILDASGRVLLSKTIQHAGGSSTVSVPMPASLSPGLYLLRTSNSERQSTTLRFYWQP